MAKKHATPKTKKPAAADSGGQHAPLPATDVVLQKNAGVPDGPAPVSPVVEAIADAAPPAGDNGTGTDDTPPPADEGSTAPVAGDALPAADGSPASPDTPPAVDDAPQPPDDRETPPPADEAPPVIEVEPPAPEPVSIDDVLRDIGTRTTPVAGYVSRSPHLHLTGEQAETLAEVFDSLNTRGVAIRDQADAVGWVLDQIRLATRRGA